MKQIKLFRYPLTSYSLQDELEEEVNRFLRELHGAGVKNITVSIIQSSQETLMTWMERPSFWLHGTNTTESASRNAAGRRRWRRPEVASPGLTRQASGEPVKCRQKHEVQGGVSLLLPSPRVPGGTTAKNETKEVMIPPTDRQQHRLFGGTGPHIGTPAVPGILRRRLPTIPQYQVAGSWPRL